MAVPVGIDLGTTFSAVAVINSSGEAEMLLNREGESITPSVVLYQNGEPIVGSMAKQMAATMPADVVQYAKRHIGDPTWRFESSGGATFSAEEVSAAILKRLKEDAELVLGTQINQAVITVPAYFDDARRRATIDAGKIAGLDVVRILNEPTAAALSFGYDTTQEGTYLVFDLGGGTFDVTLVRVSDGHFDVVATDGDRNLGGFDWDNELMKLIAGRVRDEHGVNFSADLSAEADLREKVVVAKRMLTTVEQVPVMVNVQGTPVTVAVTRSEFEQCTTGLLNRTRRLTQDVLAESKVPLSQLDGILLVGGSTRMPMVKNMLTEVAAGVRVDSVANPDEAVAKGAAIQAALSAEDDPAEPVTAASPTIPQPDPDEKNLLKKRVTISDVTSQSLGIISLNPWTNTSENFIVLPRNSKIPARATSEFSTVEENQRAIDVCVTQGEDFDPNFVTVVGSQRIPIPPYPAESPVTISLSYDVDQIIQIAVVDGTTGLELGSFDVTTDANMSDAAIIEAMERLNKGEDS